MDTSNRLRNHLTEQREAIVVVGRGADDVMASGTRMRHTRHLGYTLGLVAAVAFIGVAGFAFRATPEVTQTDQTQRPTSTTIATSPVVIDSSVETADIDWQLADTTLSNLNRSNAPGILVVSDGTFYALSTAPGKPAIPAQAIYTSDNGVSWSSQLVDGDVWLSDLAAYNGSLYAVGTGPSYNTDWTGSMEVHTAVSHDAGVTWQTADLPVTATPPVGYGDLLWRAATTRIAAGPRGVVAAVQTRYEPDLSPFMPDEYRGDDRFGVVRTDDGIDVVAWANYDAIGRACGEAMAAAGPEADPTTVCASLEEVLPDDAAVFTATWAELGVDPPLDRYSELFVSSNGLDFEPVPAPFQGTELVRLEATDRGFVAVEYDEQGGEAFRFWGSPDGRAWQEIAAPPGLDSFVDVGVFGDELVVLGYTVGAVPTGITLFASGDDGASWRDADLQQALGLGSDGQAADRSTWISSASIGPSGVLLTLFTKPPRGSVATAEAFMSTDLTHWSQLSLEQVGIDGDAAYFDSITRNGNIVLVTGSFAGATSPQWLTAAGAVR